jgi:hypothetical protein
MQKRVIIPVAIFWLVGSVHAQENFVTPEAQKSDSGLNSEVLLPYVPEDTGPASDNLDVLPLTASIATLPGKPQPMAREGDWIDHTKPWPQIPENLVVVARKDDGKWAWHVERLDSCVDCGAPLTFKQAMFDKHGSSMWGARVALMATDIELMYHMPCFESGTCRNLNPLLGHTRVQSYAVGEGLVVAAWILTAELRKGNVKYRIGSYKRWWIFPLIGDATSATGIILDLANWHR